MSGVVVVDVVDAVDVVPVVAADVVAADAVDVDDSPGLAPHAHSTTALAAMSKEFFMFFPVVVGQCHGPRQMANRPARGITKTRYFPGKKGFYAWIINTSRLSKVPNG